jgi:hypothetical protein
MREGFANEKKICDKKQAILNPSHPKYAILSINLLDKKRHFPIIMALQPISNEENKEENKA